MSEKLKVVNGMSGFMGDEPGESVDGVRVVENGDSELSSVGAANLDLTDEEDGFVRSGEVDGGRMELDSNPPYDAPPLELAQGVKGDVFVASNTAGADLRAVLDLPLPASALDELMENPSARKVLSVKNASGDEFAVVLVENNIGTAQLGAVVYERQVFFCGREVPMDDYGKPDFSDFESGKVDDTLMAGMFESFGRDLFDVDLKALNIDTEMWMAGLAYLGKYVEVEKKGKMVKEFVVDGELDDLLKSLNIDFSELGRMKSLVGVGEFFARMMPDTPMHNMITHMIQGPCRAVEAAIDTYIMDAMDAGDVKIGFEMLHRNGQRLAVITEEFLPLIVKHGVYPHPVNLAEIGEKVKRCVGDDEQRAKVEVDINPEIVGTFSEAFLLPILENAAFNAIKFGGNVRITAEEYDGAAIIRIHDTAQDIPEGVRERLFNNPVDPAEPILEGIRKGSGMGSLIAGKIINDMRDSGLPNANKFGIRFVQEPGLKFFELSMPIYDYTMAAKLNHLRRNS